MYAFVVWLLISLGEVGVDENGEVDEEITEEDRTSEGNETNVEPLQHASRYVLWIVGGIILLTSQTL